MNEIMEPGFQPARTVASAIANIQDGVFLLPAIQREFVWDEDQVIKLIDSLMQGYPIGSFLIWDPGADTQDYTFYKFLDRYHERDNVYAEKAPVMPGKSILAVLDGQQRLTALNIALNGSFAKRRKWGKKKNPNAYPEKRLYLDLLQDSADEEAGLKYNLKYLTAEEAKDGRWFEVGGVLKLKDSGPALIMELSKRGLDANVSFERLYRLYQCIVEEKVMNNYLITGKTPDEALEIFVRVNSGGTKLSYSDLLLSMATNQWSSLDAREEIRESVQDLNTEDGRSFDFERDTVLKAALMMVEADPGFKISNFTEENMRLVEDNWFQIKNAIIRAASLLKDMGFTSDTITAKSVLIPVAYYLYKTNRDDSYLTSGKTAPDRNAIFRWVVKSQLKKGIWGSGLDSLLKALRSAIRDSDGQSFPVAEIERAMAARGKSLRFAEEEIDDILDFEYRKPKTYSALALLYPGHDSGKTFHQDHIFPKSIFTRKKLVKLGVPEERVEDYLDRFNKLGNLQLLEGTQNTEKLQKMPDEWIEQRYGADEAQKNAYLLANDMVGLPLSLDKFTEFFDAREARLRDKLISLLDA